MSATTTDHPKPPALTVQWLDDEPMAHEGPAAIYNKAQITLGSSSFCVHQGDAVYMDDDHEDDKKKNTKKVLLVHRFVHDETSMEEDSRILVEGEWCWRPTDLVEQLLQNDDDKSAAATPEILDTFLDQLHVTQEVVLVTLRPTTEDDATTAISHPVSCIRGLCKLHYGEPTAAKRELATKNGNGFVYCRYRLRIDRVKKTLEWKGLLDGPGTTEEASSNSSNSFVGVPLKQMGKLEEQQDLDDKMDVDIEPEDFGTKETTQHPEDEDMADTATAGSDDDDDDDDCDSLSTTRGDDSTPAPPIQEGTNTDGEIRVGPKYQATVGPFVPNRRIKTRSRPPKLVYRANALTDSQLESFLQKVAELHTPFLVQHKMTNTKDPYILLHQERLDELAAPFPADTLLTDSLMSTSSSLLGASRVPLRKECNPDALLEFLAEYNYDTDKALEALRADDTLLDVISATSGWTPAEKAVFDAGYRKHEGELREIGDVLFPTKSVQDVVDYHYRCMIPQQFRLYQNKKREQALRIVECIQARKYGEAVSGTNGTSSCAPVVAAPSAKQKQWTEKSMSVATESRRERLDNAKELLLEVKEKLGKSKTVQIISVVRQLQGSYERETRDKLFQLLKGHPRLQKRFMEFLPKHV